MRIKGEDACQKAGCPAVLRKGWLPAFEIFLGQTGSGGGVQHSGRSS